MSTREQILQKVKAAQPSLQPLPCIERRSGSGNLPAQFQAILESIGGKAAFLKKAEPIAEKVLSFFPEAKRIVSSITSVERYFLAEHKNLVAHSLHDVDVAIIEAQFGVAENGAVWVTENELKIRALPFICEHLVAVIREEDIIGTLQEAYQRIGMEDYSFGAFIAGPSKTADIEQSLVLGAHGPKTMTVLLVSAT